MKRIIFLLVLLSFFLNSHSHERIKVEYKKATVETYRLEHYSDGDLFISNKNDPFDSKSKNPSPEWYEKVEIAGFEGDFDQIIIKYFFPYIKDLILNEEENTTLSFFYKFDLEGNLIYISFAYNSKIQIPLEAFESLEKGLKENHKIIVKKKTDNMDGMKYIPFYAPHDLMDLKRIDTWIDSNLSIIK